MSLPRVELLWWQGCPSTDEALADLRAALADAGLDPEAIEVREIRTQAEAVREGFVGSPTIRIDGRDVLPPGERERPGLTCRVYTLRDGRPSPTPDREDLRQAVAQAAADARRAA